MVKRIDGKRRFVGPVLGAGLGLLVFASAASAQQASSSDSLEEVVVTGSRIKRESVAASPTPLIQVTREDVTNSGMTNVIDILSDIPALSGSFVPEDATGNLLNAVGLSLLSLRDLGSVRTLVLVDGRRHVGADAGTLSVDVDSIPRALIERVDIITGANSAQYGADAVAGAVNFVLRKDFEGLEFDASSAMINEDGQVNNRVSVAFGKNFLNDRLNVYGFYEREDADEVTDSDIDFRRESWDFLTVDFDPASAPFDGVPDNILVANQRRIPRTFGGVLHLANDIPSNPALNIVSSSAAQCSLPTVTTAGVVRYGTMQNCVVPDPGYTYIFDQASNIGRPFIFGTLRDRAGSRIRQYQVGGDGLNRNTENVQFTRYPENMADRFQAGVNFDLNDSLQLFGEAKFVKEEGYVRTQNTFESIGIVNVPAGTRPDFVNYTAFNIGLDNAYLDPAMRTLILNNVRPLLNASGAQIGTTPDPRAMVWIFGPLRDQENEKELQRYVAGLRGSVDSVGFVSDLSYELSYTYGKLKNVNSERAVDGIRFFNSVDAVVDTAGRVNGRPGEIVCRVQLLASSGVAVTNLNNGTAYAANHPDIAQCVPSRVFGLGGYSAEAQKYFEAVVNVREQNEQQNALGFVSGNLWDLWGAGPMGFALGAEYREEKTEGIGRDRDTAGRRQLFLNAGPDFLPAKYDTTEYFGELRLPLLKDLPAARALELGVAFRSSDYSTVGSIDTYSANVVWSPIEDITLRATRGKAVRIPSLYENFAPQIQTFGNGLVDPCSSLVIAATTDARLKANRERNCAALGIPAGTAITYPSGVPGTQGGNPFLIPETAFTNTVSLIVNPRFLPRATLVLDYYEVEIKDVIAAITVQTAMNQCVAEESLNGPICATFTRTGASGSGVYPPYAVVSFIQGSANYAKRYTRGVDYQFIYRPLDNLTLRLSGNYLFDWRNHNNITAPSVYARSEGYNGFPRTRFSLTADWRYSEKLSLRWRGDFQASMYLFNANTLNGNDDVYETTKYYQTGSYIQHDFSAQYALTDEINVRGGVTNAFDKDPPRQLGNAVTDNFDIFGRRYYVGVNYKF